MSAARIYKGKRKMIFPPPYIQSNIYLLVFKLKETLACIVSPLMTQEKLN